MAEEAEENEEMYAELVELAWAGVTASGHVPSPPFVGGTAELRERLRQALVKAGVEELPRDEALQAMDAVLQWELSRKEVADWRTLPRLLSDRRLAVWKGDITKLRIGCIVNAANNAALGCFRPEHICVDNIIHCAAGPALRSACHMEVLKTGVDGRLGTGEVMLTPAFNLPADFVAHTVGPVGEYPATLGRCYTQILSLCHMRGIRSVAFCCISTGLFGYPAAKAAEVATSSVRGWLEAQAARDTAGQEPPFDLIVFNVFLESDLHIYRGLVGMNSAAEQSDDAQ